jgi:hydrogenase maturation factor
VVKEALAAAAAGARSLHDPTEGGIATGLHELADAAGVGLEIDLEALPMDADGIALCSAAGVDPLGALASGALLIVGSTEQGTAIEAAVRAVGVECRPIGEVRPVAEGRKLVGGGQKMELPTFAVDEIARWFSESD